MTISGVANPEGSICDGTIAVSLTIDDYLSISDAVNCPTYTPISLSYSVETNSSFLGEPATVNITISSLPFRTNYLIITVPTEMTLSSPSVKSPQLLQSTVPTGNSLNITITSVYGKEVVLEIRGITNPITTPSSSWNI